MTQATSLATTQIQVTTTKTRRKKTPMALGVITAGMLADLYIVPRRDTRKKTGYQREVSPTRVNRLIKDLTEDRVDLPTAVLLNLRTFRAETHLIVRDGREYFSPNDEKLYVVDGQHRVEALTRLVQMDADRWSGYEIPFVCMLGADEREEMGQFYVVNSTAKSVRTDWRSRIRLPGDPRGDATITSSGMAASLKPLLGTPYFGAITTGNQVKILDAFWQGVREVIPEAFDKPSDYVLQKATGVMAMHALLISLIEYVRSKGQSVIEATSYAPPLRSALLELEGDTGSGDVARGVDFWKAGPDGAAGSFSSNAGRRVLAVKLRALLPPMDVE